MILEALAVENMSLELLGVDHIDEFDAQDLEYADSSQHSEENHMDANTLTCPCKQSQTSSEKPSSIFVVIPDNLS